jgi:predicted dehydrogenase
MVFGGDETGCDTIADFVLEHENGCRSTFHLDFVTRTEIREFRVIGDEGDLYVDLPARTLKVRLADPKLPDVMHTDLKLYGSYNDDYLNEMRAFFDRIEGKDVPGATGEDGFNVLDILLDVRSKAGVAPR